MEKECIKIVNKLNKNKQTISFMESCTGGFLANEMTNIEGASNIIKVSLVTYSNEYKIKLGIDKLVIDNYTVYSRETAQEMAKKVSDFAQSNIGVGITGELGNTINKNKVYYSIYNKDEKKYIDKEIIVKSNKRRDMKKEVAESVFIDILGGLK